MEFSKSLLSHKTNIISHFIQGESLARGPKLLSIYTVKQRGFLVHKYWRTGSFKACQTAFWTEFGEDVHHQSVPSRNWLKKLETRGRRSNACRLLSLGAYWRAKCTKTHRAQLNNSKTLYAKRVKPSMLTLWEKDSRIWRNALKCAWKWKETSSATIMSRSCFASFPVCVYNFSSHYLNNIIFYRQ